uniref:Membrane-associated protein n=1 Tax=Plectus sambesii TaxID=2011161 RepID=A0A914V5N9_9BILA
MRSVRLLPIIALVSLGALGIVSAAVAQRAAVCNLNTMHECDCSDDDYGNKEQQRASTPPRCSDLIPYHQSIDSLLVEFFVCPFDVDEVALRKKMANWIIEECNSVLDCRGLNSTSLGPDNIVIVRFNCSKNSGSYVNFVATIAPKLRELRVDLLLHPHILGSVVQARQHLLPLLLGSDLQTVLVQPIYSTAMPPYRPRWWQSPGFIVAGIIGCYIMIVWIVACVKLCNLRKTRSKKRQYMLTRSTDERDITIGNEDDCAQTTVIHALPPGSVKAVEVRLQGQSGETVSLYENV